MKEYRCFFVDLSHVEVRDPQGNIIHQMQVSLNGVPSPSDLQLLSFKLYGRTDQGLMFSIMEDAKRAYFFRTPYRF